MVVAVVTQCATRNNSVDHHLQGRTYLMDTGVNPLQQVLEYSELDSQSHAQNASRLIQEILKVTRIQLDMEVAFVSRFIDGARVFQYVDSSAGVHIIAVGDGGPANESYCQQVVDMVTPQLIKDAQQEPSVAHLAATKAVPVGAHLSVPIYLAGGRCYGTFCVFSRKPNPELSNADLAGFKLMSSIVTNLLTDIAYSQVQFDELKRQVAYVIAEQRTFLLAQPIVDIHDDSHHVGFEALCRVEGQAWPPEKLFKDAQLVGLSMELNSVVVRAALSLLPQLHAEQYLAINVTPDFIASETFLHALQGADLAQVVIEITEHAAVNNYSKMMDNIEKVRAMGAKIAIDDVGAGYSSFRHILKVHPDIIKLDRSLIEAIDHDIEKQRLLSALVPFANQMGYKIVAEGVETYDELMTLAANGIELVQGYYFAKPARLSKFLTKPQRNTVKSM